MYGNDYYLNYNDFGEMDETIFPENALIFSDSCKAKGYAKKHFKKNIKIYF